MGSGAGVAVSENFTKGDIRKAYRTALRKPISEPSDSLKYRCVCEGKAGSCLIWIVTDKNLSISRYLKKKA